jgi:uncharacterized protein
MPDKVRCSTVEVSGCYAGAFRSVKRAGSKLNRCKSEYCGNKSYSPIGVPRYVDHGGRINCAVGGISAEGEPDSMRIFVTGATGFIGRALTLRLLGGGHQVSAWVRSPEHAKNLLGSGVRLVAASGGLQALTNEMAGSDAVVNLAGEPVLGGRWTPERRQVLWQSRIGLTTSIADAIAQARSRPSVMISASAVGYYGDRGEEVLDEQSAPGNDFLARLCRAWEESAMRAQEAGVRVFIPRIGVVLGLDGGALAQMLPPFRLGAGGPIGSGRQWLGWIDLFDLIEIIAAALEDERYRGPANAAAPLPVRSRDFARALGHLLHRPSFIPIPAFALRAILGEGACVLTSGQRVIPSRLSELGFKWRFDKVETALHHILIDGAAAIEPLGPKSPQPANPDNSGYLEKHRPAYVLRHRSRVNAPLAEVFAFFSRPQNLAVMTPADMRLQITSAEPAELSRGLRIEYNLRAAMMTLHWRTFIETYQPQRLLIDSQEQGPYRCWWHEHHFQADGAATLMEDRVYFAPPFGIVGDAASHVMVMPALRRIFRFRAQAMDLRFRGGGETPVAG